MLITLISAIGSALGGFLGTVLFFYVRWKIERARKRPENVAIYLPGESVLNNDGKLIVKTGRAIRDVENLNHLHFPNSVLEIDSRGLFPSIETEKFIFYGPYNTELNRKGKFLINYKLRCSGFNANLPFDILQATIIRFDVLRTVSRGVYSDQDIYAIKYLKYAEMINLKGNVELPVYSNGSGVWEYRMSFANDIIDTIVKLNSLNQPFTIYIENVTVKYVPEVAMPW